MLTDVDTVREVIAGHLADLFGGPRPVDLTPPIVRQAAATVTPPRPFLRWDPVPPPVVVPLQAFTEGESLRVVVVRSGVSQDPVTLEVTTQDPAAYAASVAAIAPLYAEDAKRHLAPPKTSQGQAELHGEFDAGIDEGTPAARRRMLAWALRESGSFYDRSVPHPTDPGGAPSPQPGVHLLPEPAGDPADESSYFNPSDPTRPLKVLPPAAPGTPDKFVLGPGDAPAPGQYVVHDAPTLALPYLPDPLAVGVSLAFLEAGSGRHVALPVGRGAGHGPLPRHLAGARAVRPDPGQRRAAGRDHHGARHRHPAAARRRADLPACELARPRPAALVRGVAQPRRRPHRRTTTCVRRRPTGCSGR